MSMSCCRLPQQPNAALDAVFGATGATSVFPEDRNNFGLRVGVAWEPFGAGQGVVRVGYGQYLGGCRGLRCGVRWWIRRWRASATHVRIVPTTVTDCPQVANQGFGYVCSLCDGASGGGGGDDFGDGVRPAVPVAGGAAGELGGGAGVLARGGGECDLSDES